MKIYNPILKTSTLAFPLSLLCVAVSSSVVAQTQTEQDATEQAPQQIETIAVRGRTRSAAQELVSERIEADFVADLLSIEQISRVGDTNVAESLRRVPGLTLVDGKFIYIRGLGERYSSATLNGATVPSPDLTRNVIPLDIFPTAIVESLSVQKSYSADKGAAFGGGAIDIRTTSIPRSFVAYFGSSVGSNSDSDQYLDYAGGNDFGDEDGSRALSSSIISTLDTTFINGGDYDFSANAIQQTAARNGSPITLEQAQATNRDLALSLNRQLDIIQKDSGLQDFGFNAGIGDSFGIGGDFELGILTTIDYSESIRSQERTIRLLEEPEEEFQETVKSTQNASLTVTAGVALSYGTEHVIESKNFFIRSTDDETLITDEYNDTSGFSSGSGFRKYAGIFEQRELEVYQLSGRHELSDDTFRLLGIDNDSIFYGMELNWFYSDSTATTNIPNSFNAVALFNRDTSTGDISNVNIALGGIASNGLQFENLDLDDELQSYGFKVNWPLYVNDFIIELSGGGRTDKRARISNQLNFTIDGGSAVNSIVSDSIAERFSDQNILNPDFEFELALENTDFGPSIAATQIDSAYGQIDIDWDDTLHIIAGVRYENYRQIAAIFNPLALNSPVLPDLDPNDFEQGIMPDGVFQEDAFYPSLSVKYSVPDFWAETYNLRFTMSQTTVRPDLREIVDTSYRDPVTDFIISGSSDVTPSDIVHIDLRSEWFFDNGNNFTLSLFHKDIQNPIEILAQTTQGNELRGQIANLESAEVAGIEVEWLVNLEYLGNWGRQFFIQGNLTGLGLNEISVGDDLLVNVTNRERPLTQASDYVANLVLGFDSDNAKHSAALALNAFSERIYISGEGGEADSYEQPFAALDLTYSYFVTDDFKVKFKARNILGEKNEITQEDSLGAKVTRFEQQIGQTYSLSFSYIF